MGYAVELNLDPGSAARVQTLWDELAGAGITSEMPDLGAYPHVSLAVFDEIEPARIRPVLESFAGSHRPIQVRLASVGTFPSEEGVVYLAPVVTPELLALHADFHERLRESGLVGWEYYLPGRWVPHCTVGIFLPPEKVPETVSRVRAADVFGPADLVEVTLIEFKPVRTLLSFPLSERVTGVSTGDGHE
jgi:2'-5' RNA ligase